MKWGVKGGVFLFVLLLMTFNSEAQIKSIKLIQDGVEVTDFQISAIGRDGVKISMDKDSIDLAEWESHSCDGFIIELGLERIHFYEKDQFLESIDTNYLTRYIMEIEKSNEEWFLYIDNYPFEKIIGSEYDDLVREINDKNAVIVSFVPGRGTFFTIKYKNN